MQELNSSSIIRRRGKNVTIIEQEKSETNTNMMAIEEVKNEDLEVPEHQLIKPIQVQDD